MIFDLSNELQSHNFKTRCNQFFKKGCIVELKEKKPPRTLSQNAYLHAILGYFGLQFGYKIDEVKMWYFKELCNADLFTEIVHDQILGYDRKRFKSTSVLTTSEMTLAIERFRNWSADVAGIYIPSPEEHRLILQLEIEVEQNKLYL